MFNYQITDSYYNSEDCSKAIDRFISRDFKIKDKFLIYIDKSFIKMSFTIAEPRISGSAKALFENELICRHNELASKMTEESRKTFQSVADVFDFVANNRNDLLDLMIRNLGFKDKLIEKLTKLVFQVILEENSTSSFQKICFTACHMGKSQTEWAIQLFNKIVYKYETGFSSLEKSREMFSQKNIDKLEEQFAKRETSIEFIGWTSAQYIRTWKTLYAATSEYCDDLHSGDQSVSENTHLEKCLTAMWKGIVHAASDKTLQRMEASHGCRITQARFKFLACWIFMRQDGDENSQFWLGYRESCLKMIFKQADRKQIDQFLSFFTRPFNTSPYYAGNYNSVLRSIPLEKYFQDADLGIILDEEGATLAALYFLESIKNQNINSLMKANELLSRYETAPRLYATTSLHELLKDRLTAEEHDLFVQNRG